MATKYTHEQITATLRRFSAAEERLRIRDRERIQPYLAVMGLTEYHGCAVRNAAISEIGTGWCAGPNGRNIQRAARAIQRIMAGGPDSLSSKAARLSDRWYKRAMGMLS